MFSKSSQKSFMEDFLPLPKRFVNC